MSKKKNKRYDSFVTKLGVGFDPVLDTIELAESFSLDDLTKVPPFNIKKIAEKDYVVEIALPSVKKEDISLMLDADYLTVSGVAAAAYDPEGDDVYFYKGIFQGGKYEGKFVIARNLDFVSAELVDGILTVKFVDTNKPRAAKKLPIGPFPIENKDYQVTYNSMGQEVLVPVGESPETSANAVVLTPPSLEEVPAPAEPAVEGTVETVVNAEDPATVTTTVVLPEELPQIVEVKLEDVVAQTAEGSSEPQATIVVSDATYEVSDNVSLEVIKTEEGKADIVVAIPEEVKAEAEAQGIDIIADVTAAVEQNVAAETVTLPEVSEAPKVEAPAEPIEVFQDNGTDVKFEVSVPAELPPVVELVEAPTSTPEAPVLVLETKVESEVPADAVLVPVVTKEGENDIVVAVAPELHEQLTEAGVDVSADLSSAVIAAEATVTSTPEPVEEVPTVSAVVNEFEQTKPTVEVVLPEVLPAVVEVTAEMKPVIDNVSDQPQIVLTVNDATHEIVTDNASLDVIKTDEGQTDVVVAVDKTLEATLAEAGIDVHDTVKEAFENKEEVTAEPVVESTPEAAVPELPAVVEVTVVDDKPVVSEITEIPADSELVPVVTPEGHDDVVAVVSPETSAALENLDTTVAEAVVDNVDWTEPKAEPAVEPATIAVGEPAPVAETPVVEETSTVVVNDDTTKLPTVEVTLPTELPQIVEVKIDDVTDAKKVDTKSEEPQISVTLTDATYEVSDNVTLETVKTPDGSADLIVAIPEEVQAVLDEKKIDILPAIEEAVASPEVTAPVLVEAPKDPETLDVTVVPAEELKPETEVTVTVPTEVTPVMSAEVVVNDDLGTTIELKPADHSVDAEATLVPVVTPEGQNDIVVAVSEEAKAALEASGQEVSAVLEDAVKQADVTVAEVEKPEVLIDSTEKSDL